MTVRISAPDVEARLSTCAQPRPSQVALRGCVQVGNRAAAAIAVY